MSLIHGRAFSYPKGKRHNMNKEKNKGTITRNQVVRNLFGFLSLAIIVTLIIMSQKKVSAAEASISVKEINYDNSTITLQVNSGDTKVYVSDANKKKWEIIPGKIVNGTITMDISWISTTKNYTMTFKGDYSSSILSVTLPKQVTTFKATFNKQKGTVTFNNTSNRTIEWRKKNSTIWSTVIESTLADELSNYFTKGIQLYFRLAPVNGSNTSVGVRASKEVAVTIPKKTTAPTITVNGSKFSLAVKKGMAYRKVNSDGTMSDWTNITSTTDLLISNIAPEVLYTGNSSTQKAATLQFRVNASSTSQVSNITTVKIPIQKGAPDIDTSGIVLNYTSSTTLSLTVKAASATVPYEYTIIPKEKELSYQTAVWKAITSSTAVSINSTTAPSGSKIYVRLKSVEASETTSFSLASLEVNVTGLSGVSYPTAPEATQLTTLVTTAGVCQSTKTSSYLTFYLYTATSTTVSAIDFYDSYGTKKGSVTSKSTVALNTKSTGASDKYIVTTNITSTDEINSFTEEILYANVTFANQETIKSNSTSGIQLYLYPKSIVKNPSDSEYSTAFNRIYMSTETSDATKFKFKLDFGNEKVIDPTGINKFTSESTEISSIKYSGYTLNKGTDYTVVYDSYKDEDNSTIRTATVTVNVSNFEKSSEITAYDQATPLIINLNNNEVVDKAVTIKLVRTATIDNTPIAWSLSEGGLTEKTTSTITNEDGSTTTVTQDVVTFSLTLTMFSQTYSVSVANVTWGNVSIFGSASISNGKATIYLSNAKINKLTTNSSDTKNVVITLSNGYVIDTGCKLTILNAN